MWVLLCSLLLSFPSVVAANDNDSVYDSGLRLRKPVDPPRRDYTLPSPEPVCGPNSAFLFLRLHGVSLTPDEAHEDLPMGKDGATMLDLKAYCQSHGIDARVVRVAPNDLAYMRMPVIAHMEDTGADGIGHYVLVTGVTGGGFIDGMDGTTLSRVRFPPDEFRRSYTGHLLVEGARPFTWALWVERGLAAACFVLASVLVWLVVSVVRQRRRARAGYA